MVSQIITPGLHTVEPLVVSWSGPSGRICLLGFLSYAPLPAQSQRHALIDFRHNLTSSVNPLLPWFRFPNGSPPAFLVTGNTKTRIEIEQALQIGEKHLKTNKGNHGSLKKKSSAYRISLEQSPRSTNWGAFAPPRVLQMKLGKGRAPAQESILENGPTRDLSALELAQIPWSGERWSSWTRWASIGPVCIIGAMSLCPCRHWRRRVQTP
ncbi:uncharacterized protein VTP21DRAFT_4668 [Calcarisporiella thermophila]|uniref:uncharacterized protein n=1 Tax=Calcarisporiella thermophila TaxID=911321 RepID=UPI0037425DD8